MNHNLNPKTATVKNKNTKTKANRRDTISKKRIK